MNLTFVLIIAAAFLFLAILKRYGQISSKDARAQLRNGALLVDVRSPGEFNSGHLVNAINIPLDEIAAIVPRRLADKNQVLLLHCQSGMRSGTAEKRLKGLGYVKAFNLGSYARAAKIVSSE